MRVDGVCAGNGADPLYAKAFDAAGTTHHLTAPATCLQSTQKLAHMICGPGTSPQWWVAKMREQAEGSVSDVRRQILVLQRDVAT